MKICVLFSLPFRGAIYVWTVIGQTSSSLFILQISNFMRTRVKPFVLSIFHWRRWFSKNLRLVFHLNGRRECMWATAHQIKTHTHTCRDKKGRKKRRRIWSEWRWNWRICPTLVWPVLQIKFMAKSLRRICPTQSRLQRSNWWLTVKDERERMAKLMVRCRQMASRHLTAEK